MQQSSKAQDRTLGNWFSAIEQGHLKLPSFQRHEAWDRNRIVSFLNIVIDNLPVGITLVLDVAGKEQFESRFIETAPQESKPSVNQHLLDGQQRLTAFWRSMHNNYESESYFIYIPKFDELKNEVAEDEVSVVCQQRWLDRQNRRNPVWANEPESCLKRGLIPIDLLRPGNTNANIDKWIEDATRQHIPPEKSVDLFKQFGEYQLLVKNLKSDINELCVRVNFFNLPYLALPANTDKATALQVFINMNTNSKVLSLYDIIVAEIEQTAQISLHNLQKKLEENNPKLKRYGDLSRLILTTSALLQEKLPNNRGMTDMDKRSMVDNWPKMEKCLSRMANFLESQGVYDEQRLPTNAVLAVIAAAYVYIPEVGDYLGKAEKLLRRYLWSSFFTDRYQNSAASRAHVDYMAIISLLKNKNFSESQNAEVPVLNREDFPLTPIEKLSKLGWPKKSGINERGILAITTNLGATDFADGQNASYESIQLREYHHIFPDALLKEAGMESSLALNCALITGKTNRDIGRKDPLKYIKERTEWAEESTIRQRLKTHLISYDLLAQASYEKLDEQALKIQLKSDFEGFLNDRSNVLYAAIQRLTLGETISVDMLLTKSM